MAPVITSPASFVADDFEFAPIKGTAEVMGGSLANHADKRTAVEQIELCYYPFPKQNEFHSSPAKYRLFGGAAGPGKSKALLMEAVLQAHEVPGANTLLLRRTFSELEQSLLLYFRRDIPRELYRSYNESKHLVTWWNGSTTRFGYCQSEADVYQYQGAEFLFIGIDELTLFTLRQWQFLTSRNRCPVPGAFSCMAGATNPGNIGHAWVKSLWIDKQPAPGMEHPEEFDASDYDFIPARVSDNPVYAGDENYLKTLRALPSHLKRAFLDGDWDVFAGQYFDRFDCSRHVIRAEQIDWKPWWPRWISIDWGFEHPAAVYWHAQAPARTGQAVQTPLGTDALDVAASAGAACCAPTGMLADGLMTVGDASSSDKSRRIVTYREFVTHRTSPRDLAREIVARSLLSDCHYEAAAADEESALSSHNKQQQQVPRRPENGLCRDDNVGGNRAGREKIDAIYLSPDAFARRTDEASIADQMGDVFVAAGFPRPIPADNDRVGGWMLMYQMLDAGEWLLTENCVELIRTIPNLVRDTARVEDIEKMDGDDPADAARYGLKSRYGAGRSWQTPAPIEQRVAERVTSTDPFGRAMQIRKFQMEEKRGIKPVSFLNHHRRR
jgi:Terminase large subunit, T4likevirus-type, N-terminal